MTAPYTLTHGERSGFPPCCHIWLTIWEVALICFVLSVLSDTVNFSAYFGESVHLHGDVTTSAHESVMRKHIIQ
jgi:hypothetical protein